MCTVGSSAYTGSCLGVSYGEFNRVVVYIMSAIMSAHLLNRLLPGITITIALLEIFSKMIVYGASRLMYGIFLACQVQL